VVHEHTRALAVYKVVWIIYEAGSVNHEAVCGAAGSVHKEAVRDAWEAADVRRLVRVVDILLVFFLEVVQKRVGDGCHRINLGPNVARPQVQQ